MTNFFTTLLNMSIIGGIIILVVMLLRLCLKKLPKRFSYILWVIPAFRLLCPVSISSAVSIFNLFNPQVNQNRVDIMLDLPKEPTPDAVIHVPTAPHEPLAPSEPITVPVPQENGVDLFTVLTWVWLFGAVIVGIITLLAYLNVYRSVRFSEKKDGYYLCENIDSPFVFGFAHPKIYIPFGIFDKDLDCILLHEKAHIKRFDHIVKTLTIPILILHWFNPLVWLGVKLMTCDMESSCDELALKNTDSEYRKAYANALLNISMKQNRISFGVLGFGESSIKSRIKGILNMKKPTVIIIIIAVIAIVVTSICLLTNAQKSDQNPPDSSGTVTDNNQSSSVGTVTGNNQNNSDSETINTENAAQNNAYTAYSIKFPNGYDTETDYNKEILEIAPFEITADIPAKYTVSADTSGEMGAFFSRYLILDENKNTVGTFGYHVIPEELSEDELIPQAIYNQIALGNHYQFNVRNKYEVVSSDDKGETAITEVYYSAMMNGGTEKLNKGVVAYNLDCKAYVAFDLEGEAFSDEDCTRLAGSIEFTAAANTGNDYLTYAMTFPNGYDTETDYNKEVLSIAPFEIAAEIPAKYTVSADTSGEMGAFFSRYLILDENKNTVGTFGYHVIPEELSEDELIPQAIYNQIALGNHYQFNVRNKYEVVSSDDKGETAVTEVYYSAMMNGGTEKLNKGVVAYNLDCKAYVAFDLEGEAFSDEDCTRLAESIKFTPAVAKPNETATDEDIAFLAKIENLVNSAEKIEDLRSQITEIEAVTDVWVHKSSDNEQLYEGDTENGMVVRIFYGENSWAEYTINKPAENIDTPAENNDEPAAQPLNVGFYDDIFEGFGGNLMTFGPPVGYDGIVSDLIPVADHPEWDSDSLYLVEVDSLISYSNDGGIYRVKILRDLIGGEEQDRLVNVLLPNGNPKRQVKGDPAYAPGEKFTVVLTLPHEAYNYLRAPAQYAFRYDVREENGVLMAYSRVMNSRKNEMDSLYLSTARDINESVITSTTENPAVYSQVMELNSLAEFLRNDWQNRGISSHFR